MPSIDDVNILLNERHLDILCVGETFLSDTVSDNFLIFPGYVFERKDRKTHGGGVGIIYRDSMRGQVMDVPTTGSQLESLWMCFTGRSRFTLGVLYRPPSSSVPTFLEDLHRQLTYLLTKQQPLYIMGDVNLDLLKPTATEVQQYCSLLRDLSIEQLVTTPTRTTATTATLIDHVLTTRPDLTADPLVIPCSISDHDLTAVSITAKRERRKPATITVRSTRRVDNDALCLDLLMANWGAVYGGQTPSEKWSAWLAVWQPVIDAHMPLRTVRLRHPPSPWLHENDELRQCMKDRDEAREARDLNRQDPEKEQAFRECRNAVKRMQFRACSEFYATSYKNSRARTWKDIRKFLLASKKPEPRVHEPSHSGPSWAERLNKHFVTVGAEVASALTAADQGERLSPRPPRVVSDCFRVRAATLPELSLALRTMNNSRACSSDGITVDMLRRTFAVVGPHLLHVVNSSLVTGQVPAEWKSATVLPLFKKGDPADPGNYRPISILSVVGKLCEKLVNSQLSSYLEKNHILSKSQHGFRSGHSTETAMLDTVSYLITNRDSGRISTMLAADTSKAFDSVEHNRLLEKLGWYGINSHWFKDWLADRTQQVQGSSVPPLPITHGVIQGSNLGPKLFLLFTNDMTSHLTSGKQVMFADDVQFLDSDTPQNLEMLKLRVEDTLDSALNWFTQNRLKVNPAKTELVVVKPVRKKVEIPACIRFGTAEIKPSPHAKILGVMVDSALSWEKQVSQVTRQCYCVLIGLSKLRHKIPRETKKLLVEALVFPYVQYCLTAWGGCNVTQRKRIQKIINFGARIVSAQHRREHISPTLQTLGWASFEEMISARDIAAVERLLSDSAPPALAGCVTRRTQISSRQTRGTEADMLDLPKIRTEAAKRSFPYRAVKVWNERMLSISKKK